jgi:alkanesulfonate monooxygenase SsuD/methylene tetrahydromethanopterin reductase-like flavin-dependent oxidoreductase (luciferase family)
MILVAWRSRASGEPWCVWPRAANHAEAFRVQAALVEGGYVAHVFEHETVEDLKLRHRFDGFTVSPMLPVPVARKPRPVLSLFGEGQF